MSPQARVLPVHASRSATSEANKTSSSGLGRKGHLSSNPGAEQSRHTEIEVDTEGTSIIDRDGDILVFCQADEDADKIGYLVSSAKLKDASSYFSRLLTDTRFAEGAAIAEAVSKTANGSETGLEERPRVDITVLARISPVKSIRGLMGDLLFLLHFGHLPAKRSPLANLANLAIVADRFDVLDAYAYYIARSNALLRPKGLKAPLGEADLRQRLLIGIMTGDEDLVFAHSKQLIMSGSYLWPSSDDPEYPNDALWWDLPQNIEDELQVRRNAILDTTWSLIEACLKAYTSRARQCRLGYDTSPQCDAFQLGEYVKFLTRAGFLCFSSKLALERPPSESAGDISDILSTLRACPAYQVDANHSHCGPRKHMLAGLALIESYLTESDISVCLECWNDRQNLQRSWAQGNKVLTVDSDLAAKERSRWESAVRGHMAHSSKDRQYESAARDFFTAREKLWVDGSATPGQ